MRLRSRFQSPFALTARAGLGAALVCVACVLLSVGCAAALRAPLTPRPLPSQNAERDRLLANFGQRLYSAMRTGELKRVLINPQRRAEMLRPEVVDRMVHGRSADASALPPAERALWREGSYAGLCVQSGRLELPFGVVGLKTKGFLFERGLLIGREPGGGALAGWVEGVFVLTNAGFVAIAIQRIEPPRRDHSDLELAECELADRRPPPQDVVSSGALHH